MEVADTQAQLLREALQSSKSDETDGVVGTVKMKSVKNPKGSGEAQHAVAKQTSKQPRQACYRCGRKGHVSQECWHRNKECRTSARGKKGHIAVVCRSSKKATVAKPRKV